MCVVKTGKDVQMLGDLQNLITSAVLRQIGVFDETSVKQYTADRLAGLVYENSEEIDDLISNTLKTLSRNDTVSVCKGGYRIQELVAF